MKSLFGAVLTACAMLPTLDGQGSIPLQHYKKVERDCCVAISARAPIEKVATLRSINELVDLARQNMAGRKVVHALFREIESELFAHPKPSEGWTFRDWASRHPNALDNFKGRQVELVLTPTAGRVRLALGTKIEDEKRLEFGVVTEFDRLLLNHFAYLHILKDAWPGVPEAIVYLSGAEAARVRSAISDRSAPQFPIRLFTRLDACFGVDGYYPWANPFAGKSADCPTDASALSASLVCEWRSGNWKCREETYRSNHGALNR